MEKWITSRDGDYYRYTDIYKISIDGEDEEFVNICGKDFCSTLFEFEDKFNFEGIPYNFNLNCQFLLIDAIIEYIETEENVIFDIQTTLNEEFNEIIAIFKDKLEFKYKNIPGFLEEYLT